MSEQDDALLKSVIEYKIEELDFVRDTSSHEIYFCPNCESKKGSPDTVGKLYFSKIKDLGWCFRCKTAVIPYDENRTKDEAAYLLKRLSNVTKANLEKELKLVEMSNSLSNLPELNYEEMFSPPDERAISYLESRHPILPHLIDGLNIKCDHRGVIFPFYYKNKVVKYQLRYYNNPNMKYYTSIGPKIMYSPGRLFDFPNRVDEVTLVEGTFDCIGALLLGYKNPLGILGSSITDLNIRLLRTIMPSVINIFMDDVSISYSIKSELRGNIPSCERINVIRSWGDDPEEVFKKQLYSDKIEIESVIQIVNNFNEQTVR